jgi:pimeloyl-ACP methyl ester carboxylesterase
MAIATCVLVHGGWHGGWHWDEIVRRLRASGVRVFAPTLRGLAERAAEATATTSLADHVDDVVRVLDNNDLRDVMLVGHSYGGAVITGAAHKRPDRVAQLVYLDAFVPQHGESLADIFGAQFAANAREQARAAGTPHLVPAVFSMEDVLGVEAAEAALHAVRLSAHPLGTLFDPLEAANPVTATRNYIYCSRRPLGMFEGYAQHARGSADWRYFELPSPHDAVYAMPAVVAGILEHLALGRRVAQPQLARASVLDADRRFFDALLASDGSVLEALLAADFVIVDIVAGSVTDRAAFIGGVASRAVQFDAITTVPEDALVRVHGDSAIVVGCTQMVLRVPGQAEPVRVNSRYTHVFHRTPADEWQLGSAQGTQIG